MQARQAEERERRLDVCLFQHRMFSHELSAMEMDSSTGSCSS